MIYYFDTSALDLKDMGPVFFVSADRKLLKAAEKEGFKTINPEL